MGVVGRVVGEVEETAEDIEEISDYDSSGRMHVPGDYDLTEDQVRAHLDGLSLEEETADSIYDDIKDTDLRSEEVYEVLVDNISLSDLDIGADIDRRNFLRKSAATVLGGYGVEASANHAALHTSEYGAQVEAPSGSRHMGAIDAILEGENPEVHIFDVYTEQVDGPEYDSARIEEEVESRLNELEGVNMEVIYHEVLLTPENLADSMGTGVSEEDASRYIERFQETLRNSGQGQMDPAYLEGYIDKVVDFEEEGVEGTDIKMGVADYMEDGVGGLSTIDLLGNRDWALSARMEETPLIYTLTHEAGHKLGLPHTYYPDAKRGGVLPDIMSYSSVFRTLDQLDLVNASFGPQSKDNWKKVKEIHSR